MLKFLASIFIFLVFVSCGVDTSSSSQTANVEESTETDDLTLPPLVELNPIVDVNSTVPDDGTTDPGDGTTDPGDVVNPGDGGSQADSIFSVENAVYDKFACFLGNVNDGYTNNIIKDDSYDYLGEIDEEDGLGITSRYAFNSDVSKTEVVLYYYDLLLPRAMNVVSISEDLYTVTIDTAWAQNAQSVVYVRTPKDKDDLFGCYRYDLQSIDVDGNAQVTKVYKLN